MNGRLPCHTPAISFNASYVSGPWPSLQAAHLGNVSAMECMAKLHDSAGDLEEGMRWWRRTAKAGLMEGQFRLGLALYRGSCGCVLVRGCRR